MILLASYYYILIILPKIMLCHTLNDFFLIYSINQISIISKVNELYLILIYLVMNPLSLFTLFYPLSPNHSYIPVNSIYLLPSLMLMLSPRASILINPLSTSINNQIIMCRMYLYPSSPSHYPTRISPRYILYICLEHSSVIEAPNLHIMLMLNYKRLI